LGWFLGCFVSIQIWAAPSDPGKDRANGASVHSNGVYWRKIVKKMRTVESVMEKIIAEQSSAAKINPPAPKKNSAPQNPTFLKKTARLSISAAGKSDKSVKILNPSALKSLPKAKFVSQKTFEKNPEKVPEILKNIPEKTFTKIPRSVSGETLEKIPEKFSEKIFEKVPETSKNIPEKIAKKVPEKTSKKVPENVLGEILEKVFEKTSKNENSSASNKIVAAHWEKFKLPPGCKMHNVPGDGLCGFWATLAALKVKEKGNAASVRVEKKEIFELLKRLSNRIAQLIKKESKTPEEQEMICELDQLIRDGYAKDYDDLCRKLEQGKMQLDSPLAMFLAQEINYNIVLHWEGVRRGERGHVREQYGAKNPRGTIMIYYSGNGSGGHYQAIIPADAHVDFN
jgi:hypothetical protein